MQAAMYYRAQRWPDVISTLAGHDDQFRSDAFLSIAVKVAVGSRMPIWGNRRRPTLPGRRGELGGRVSVGQADRPVVFGVAGPRARRGRHRDRLVA
ncbi:AAA ATPase, central domain protein [Mycobacterium xenopi 3993]|nr:AAA ATPase, central domain protein [Mycobacterium xenopi 3993]